MSSHTATIIAKDLRPYAYESVLTCLNVYSGAQVDYQRENIFQRKKCLGKRSARNTKKKTKKALFVFFM